MPTNASPPPRRVRARRPLTARQQKLAANYLPFALSLIEERGYLERWPEAEAEFRSAAQLAIVQAAESWRPSRGVKFTTFAKRRIIGACQDVQREMLPLGDREGAARDEAPTIRVFIDGAHEPFAGGPPVGSGAEDLEAFEDWLAFAGLDDAEAEACRAAFVREDLAADQGDVLERALRRLRGDDWPADGRDNPDVPPPAKAPESRRHRGRDATYPVNRP